MLFMNKYLIVFITFLNEQLRRIPYIELTDHSLRFRDTMVARYICHQQIVWCPQIVNEFIIINMTLFGAVGFMIKYKFSLFIIPI